MFRTSIEFKDLMKIINCKTFIHEENWTTHKLKTDSFSQFITSYDGNETDKIVLTDLYCT